MPYCQNCGTEVEGNFCPNCGAQAGSITPNAPQLIIHKDADVKPRFNAFHMLIAGWFGSACLIMTLACFAGLFFAEGNFGDKITFLVTTAFGAGLTFLCYLPGINSVRKRTPEGEVVSTLKTFIVKSILFLPAWAFTLVGCTFIVGILLSVWRVGLRASRPKDDQYTAFVNGEKISVTRCIDDLPDYGVKGKWVYVDENGEFYRPPVH